MKPFAELTYLGQIRKLRQVAQAALDAYGLNHARLKFVARSENTTRRLEKLAGGAVHIDLQPIAS